MHRFCVVALLVLAPAAPAAAQDDHTAEFELFNDCNPMNLVVEGLPEGAEEIDLTKNRLQTQAESRLRAARLYDDEEKTHYLYVRVQVDALVGLGLGTYAIEVSYNKFLFDPVSRRAGYATTWRVGSTGRGDAPYIRQHVSEYLDEFILGYLRVNEDACDQ